LKSDHLKDLFSENPHRAQEFSLEFGNLFLDYSKNRVTKETLDLLIKMLEELNLKDKISAMFSGEKINITENRAVLHTALRDRKAETLIVDGINIMSDIKKVLTHMVDFADKIRSGQWLGYTGKSIKNIVNIGIGGSD